jgi:hypothetical protein
MSLYHAGQSLRLTDDGRLVTIWSAAHLPGTYWAHLGEGDGPRPVVLIRIKNKRDSATPVVTLAEDS